MELSQDHHSSLEKDSAVKGFDLRKISRKMASQKTRRAMRCPGDIQMLVRSAVAVLAVDDVAWDGSMSSKKMGWPTSHPLHDIYLFIC